jgi:hypothetical protein
MGIKVVTPEFRASYVNVVTPKTNDDGKEVYSLSMIFDKEKTPKADMEKMQNAIKEACAEKWGKEQAKWPRQLRICLHDADQEERANPNAKEYDPNYVGTYFMNAKTFNAPGIVDENVEPLMDAKDFYSGCYARATVTFAAYDKAGNRGVGCYLGNLMKTRDGEPLGGGAPADVDFAAFKPAASSDASPFG